MWGSHRLPVSHPLAGNPTHMPGRLRPLVTNWTWCRRYQELWSLIPNHEANPLRTAFISVGLRAPSFRIAHAFG